MYLHKIDVKFFLIIWHLLAVATSSYNVAESTDGKSPTTSLKNVILSSPPDVSMSQNDDEDRSSCREISLHRCGSSMVRVFRLLDFLPWKKSFDAKCALRKAFFECMKAEDDPCKKRHWRLNRSTKFRKKLVRSLWSTRGCVLRLKNDGSPI